MPVPGEYSLLRQTAAENPGTRGQGGFATLGNALAGGNEATGEMAFARGQQIGAQTIDALAQARARVRQNEAAESTAAFIESDQGKPLGDMLGVTDDMRHYIAATVRGQGEEAGAKVALDLAQEARRSRIEKGSADPRVGAALALTPAEVIPKAIGTAGSITQPLDYDPNRPTTATYISPQQSRENEAGIAQKNAAATASLAAAKERGSVDIPPGMPKPPQGYIYGKDANGQFTKDESGVPNLVPVSGGPKDPNAAGAMTGRESQMFMRGVNGARTAVTDLKNALLLPLGTTQGTFGVGAAPGKSILHAGADTLRNSLTDEDTQQLSAAFTGIARGMSFVENSGLAPPGSFVNQLNDNLPRKGDTMSTVLWKYAQIRQIIENGSEVAQQNPRVPQKMKDYYQELVDQVHDAVPWTPKDVMDLRAGKGTDIMDVVSKRNGPAPTAAAAPNTGLMGVPVSAIEAEQARRAAAKK